MGILRVPVAPEVLYWAVERAGWDEATVAKRAPKLERWAQRDPLPTLKQLEEFARATHTPVGMLFLSQPPDETVPIPDLRTIGNQTVRRPSADMLDTIYLCQSRQDWYLDFALAVGKEPLPFVGSATTNSDVRIVADNIRHILDFEVSDRVVFLNWEEALRGLVDRSEAMGVLVMISGIVGSDTHRRLNPKEFRGFALADRFAPLVFVNGADTKAAQIFTLMHEIAHLWLGESALSDAAMNSDHGIGAEMWCNRVAAEVLVPKVELLADYGGEPKTSELDRLAKRYRASTLAVLKQIADSGLISWDAYLRRYEEELERVMARLAERRGDSSGGNYYNTHPRRISRQFAKAVLTDTFEGRTSYTDAYRLLGIKKAATLHGLADELGVA